MDQGQLFRLAPEAIIVNAFYEVPDGWRLRIVVRRQGEHFSDSHDRTYSHLSLAELLDVISAEVLMASSAQ